MRVLSVSREYHAPHARVSPKPPKKATLAIQAMMVSGSIVRLRCCRTESAIVLGKRR